MSLALSIGTMLALVFLSSVFFACSLSGIQAKIVRAINASANNQSPEIDFLPEAFTILIGLVLFGVAVALGVAFL